MSWKHSLHPLAIQPELSSAQRPTFSHGATLAPLLQYPENLLQPLPDFFQIFWRAFPGEGQTGLPLRRFRFVAEVLAGSGNRVTLIVKQPLNAQHTFDITLAIHSLPGAALD